MHRLPFYMPEHWAILGHVVANNGRMWCAGRNYLQPLPTSGKAAEVHRCHTPKWLILARADAGSAAVGLVGPLHLHRSWQLTIPSIYCIYPIPPRDKTNNQALVHVLRSRSRNYLHRIESSLQTLPFVSSVTPHLHDWSSDSSPLHRLRPLISSSPRPKCDHSSHTASSGLL